MADDLFCTGPGPEPAVVASTHQEQDRRATEDFVLDLTAQTDTTDRGGLTVEDRHVDAGRGLLVLQLTEDDGLGGALDELHLGHVRGGPATDRQPDLLTGVGLVAVDQHSHPGARVRVADHHRATVPSRRSAAAHRGCAAEGFVGCPPPTVLPCVPSCPGGPGGRRRVRLSPPAQSRPHASSGSPSRPLCCANVTISLLWCWCDGGRGAPCRGRERRD